MLIFFHIRGFAFLFLVSAFFLTRGAFRWVFLFLLYREACLPTPYKDDKRKYAQNTPF